MNFKKKLFYFLSVKETLQATLNGMSLKYHLHKAELQKDCFYFEIEVNCFNIEFYKYVHDFADSLDVSISKNDSALFKITYNIF